ncbi:MAG: tyrosine-type recombinase/integrase [Mycobacterium sp.]|nr:tyrosine-type recombinase/integrase [Mycobacterium sp.]
MTHLIEAGYDPLFVQQQVGHEQSSTTALYTQVSSDYRHLGHAVIQHIDLVVLPHAAARVKQQDNGLHSRCNRFVRHPGETSGFGLV